MATEHPELAALARAKMSPLGPGEERRRVLSEGRELLGTTRPDRLRVAVATGEIFLEVLPHGIHNALQTGFSLLEADGLGWLREWLAERGLDVAPSRLGVALLLPLGLVRATDPKAILVTDEAAAIVERHCRELEAAFREHAAHAKTHLARARSFLAARQRALSPGNPEPCRQPAPDSDPAPSAEPPRGA
jgi:hypothetical protein